MSGQCGPYRIVALHCGKFDFAEVELDVPVHLIGPNNVGKTSLIALLQFLYLDDQRQMHFSREMAETRRYYFPEKYSYALFECLTPSGFQVVGVRGLGPVRQYEFERFVYSGRIELDDFLDDRKRSREPEETDLRLALKGFKRMEPRHLRAALTGSGDSKDVHLGLVPARQAHAYERFRKVFCNILRLSHVRQDELKQLLLDIYTNEFQQREIDLSRHYATGYEQVKRDSLEVQELKLLQDDVERLLTHLERREKARAVIPALWEAIGAEVTRRKAEFDRQESGLSEKRYACETGRADLQVLLEKAGRESQDLTRKESALQQQLRALAIQRERFREFVPEWSAQRLATIRTRRDDVAGRLGRAAGEPLEAVLRKLAGAGEQLKNKRVQLENLANALVTHLRRNLTDVQLAAAFSVIHPDWLKVPVNGKNAGVADPKGQAAKLIKDVLNCKRGDFFEFRGIRLSASAVTPPDVAAYLDPERIQADIADLERDVERYEKIAQAVREEEALKKEKTELDREYENLIAEVRAYEAFQAEAVRETEWNEELAAAQERAQVVNGQKTTWEHQRNGLFAEEQQIKSELDELRRRRESLLDQLKRLERPRETWPVLPVDNLPEELDDLAAFYKKTAQEEQSQAEVVKERMDTIEKRTYGRYARAGEADTIAALREQMESIPEREHAVSEMWKGIAVGIKKDLQNINKDLETLKGLIGTLNRRLGTVNVSNLSALKLLIEENPQWVRQIRDLSVEDEMPLFGNPKAASQALEGIGRLLAEHPRVNLMDLFNLCFEVTTPDGKSRRHDELESIESNGTTIAIKVLVNLILMRDLLGDEDVQIPFYLDECSSLDQGNLAAIVKAARERGFVAVLASPEAMDAAEKLYFIEESGNGRVVLDPASAMVRIVREPETGKAEAS